MNFSEQRIARCDPNWKRQRIKHHISQLYGGGTPATTETSFWTNGTIPWVSSKDMKVARLYETEDYITPEAVDRSASNTVEAGAILMVVRSGILKHSIPVAINTVKVAINQDIKALVLSESLDTEFFYYWITGQQKDLLLEWGQLGATVDSLNVEILRNTVIPLPEKSHQRLVVSYLDRETARIDGLIEKKGRFIELLKEKRAAVITHAVTKGIDAGVPMKNSGVFWIGKHPQEWSVCKLNLRYTVELGKMLDEKKIAGVHLTPYLRNRDVQWGSINTTDLPEMDIHPSEVSRYTLKRGDLLVCEGGDVGRSAIWAGDEDIYAYQKALHRLRVRDRSKDDAEFLLYCLSAAKLCGAFEEREAKSTISHLTAEAFRTYLFPFPPLQEQKRIVEFLNVSVSKIDRLIATTNRSIELLKEKRSALITAAVTGKIDVRNAA